MKVVLVACSSQKLPHAAPARELYTSQLFTKALAYARTQTSEQRIFVMSAMHGLVPLDRILTPYDRELKQMPKRQRLWWGINLVDSLRQRMFSGAAGAGKPTSVVLLGGADYNVPVRSALHRIGWAYEQPLEGLNIGQRLQWLKQHVPAPAAVPEPEPDPVLDVIIPKGPPIFRPTEPYVKQTSSTLHGWRIEVYDPTVSEHAVLCETSVKKYTQAQKLRLLSIYKHRKENHNAEDHH